ncbi:hypothetical protein BD311DRAFT_772297 [Dichomitus squalens]|uniref:Uncharacterized protein n=1 Tax=Dichomitus squalens TaxID=114155 RepID=A0A4Q9M3B3_9APHY|nr:hypothetical protein BD311DRAFT_772297 [Dichomitus squalens]
MLKDSVSSMLACTHTAHHVSAMLSVLRLTALCSLSKFVHLREGTKTGRSDHHRGAGCVALVQSRCPSCIHNQPYFIPVATSALCQRGGDSTSLSGNPTEDSHRTLVKKGKMYRSCQYAPRGRPRIAHLYEESVRSATYRLWYMSIREVSEEERPGSSPQRPA